MNRCAKGVATLLGCLTMALSLGLAQRTGDQLPDELPRFGVTAYKADLANAQDNDPIPLAGNRLSNYSFQYGSNGYSPWFFTATEDISNNGQTSVYVSSALNANSTRNMIRTDSR